MENNKINEGALTKQIKTLVMQERYEEAMKVLDEIEVSKIRNISILCLVGEVYMGLKRYDEAEQILLRVYEKNPNTRRILDLLTTLYIDKGEYSEAEYYYKEFIGVASRDLHRYILRYRLDKGKGERLSVLIDTLEKLKDYEYIEEWAYELATLYEASGETKKCIHECDEIVLWFGHGEYVDKAIALKCKLTGEPLPEISTVEQHRVEEEQRAAHEKQLTESIGAEMGIEGFAGADYEGSIDLDLIQRAMDGAAPEAADEPIVETAVTEDTLRDEVIVEEPVLEENEEPVLEENEEPTLEENEESAGSAEGEETQDAAMAVDAGNTDSETVNADGNTADDDGHAESVDEDSEAEQPDEENEKSHIAHLFSSLMFGRKEKEKHFDWSTLKLAKEKGEKPDEIELAAAAITAAQSQESQEGEKDEDIFLHEEMPVEEMSENTVAEDAPEKEVSESEEAEDAAISTEGLSEEDADFFGKLMGEDLVADYTRSQDSEEEIIVDDDGESVDTVIIDDDDDDSENEAPEAAATEDEIIIDGDGEKDEVIPETKEDTLDDLFGIAGEVHEDELIDDDDEDEVISEDDSSSQNDSADEEEDEDDEEDEISDDIHASDTVLDIFGTVTGVESIKSQLAKTFTKFEDPALDNMDLLAPYDINFVVTGYDMSVKSQIAIGIAKALNTYGICDKNKLVRATAQDLNGRDFSMIFEKLKGGCLIIDGAGMLDDKAAGIIVDFVQQDNQDVAIVLEGEEDKIKELFRKYPVLHSKFLNIIHIGKYNENELVQLAEGYAKKKGYEISGPGAASLKTLLRERMQDGYSVDYEDIMAIIEEAIASLEKRNMKNLFMTVLDNKYEEAAMFMLQPEDFKNINIPD